MLPCYLNNTFVVNSGTIGTLHNCPCGISVPSKEELQDGFKIGDWEVLPAQGVLRCGDREETPEPLVFKLLMALATRDGNVASKEDLVTEVWDGYPVGDDSITRCVAQLRKHLGEQGKTYVKTLTKRGYRLDEKVSFEAPGKAQVAPDVPASPLRKQRNQWMVVAAIVVALVIGSTTDIGGIFGKGQVDSIAVLPFENLSGDVADQYRVAGFKAELVQTLHKLPGISVKSGLDTYPNQEVSEIAGIFDVDAVLFGELQRIGSALKITYRIAHGSDGEVIATGEFEGQVGEEFALQEQMAYQVRSVLTGEPAQQLISETRHPNSGAYDRYMRGLFLLERRGRGRPENLDLAIDLFGQAIEIDPAYGALRMYCCLTMLMSRWRSRSSTLWRSSSAALNRTKVSATRQLKLSVSRIKSGGNGRRQKKLTYVRRGLM